MFKEQPNISFLYLCNNQIEEPPEKVFHYLPNLVSLRLRFNKLTAISETMFINYNSKLRDLSLRGNKIHEEAFRNLGEVLKLILSDNCIQELPQNL